MSRSRAKHWRFGWVDTFFKRLANRRVRRTKDVPNGSGYKKLFDSCSICDFGRSQVTEKDKVDWGLWIGRK